MTIRPAGYSAPTPSPLPAWLTAILHRMRRRGSGRTGRTASAGRGGRAGRTGRSAILAVRLDRADAVRAEAERRRVWL
ncbi:hypothetical protein [Leifsonia lichenia]